MDFIDLKSQQARIKPQLDARMAKVLSHGAYIMGPEIEELEARLAAYANVKYCISCSSGTDALLIALMAIGVKPGDEILTTPFTFMATGEMIALAGAKPTFVDIDARTYNMDPAQLEARITPRTRAIVPVSLYGQCADMDAINAIGRRHGIPVIEDAAQSFGATYKGRRSCGLSDLACTSFFPSKPLGAYGDGGACFTNDETLAKLMREVRNHGQERRYYHVRLGLNGRLDTLQAAILLAKMDILDDEIAARERLGARYSKLFREKSGEKIRTPHIEAHNTSPYAQYTVEVAEREAVQAKLQRAGVPTAVHYPVPLTLQPVFRELGHGPGSFPVAESAAQRVLSLPMHPYLSEKDQELVVDSVVKAVQG